MFAKVIIDVRKKLRRKKSGNRGGYRLILC